MDEIFNRVEALLKVNNMKKTDLESKLDFNAGTIDKLKRHVPNVEKIIKIADFFNVSVDYLCGKTPIPNGLDPMKDTPEYFLEFILEVKKLNLSKEQLNITIEYLNNVIHFQD